MTFERFSIILDNSSCLYNAGEEITGSVVVVLKKSIRLRGITVELSGNGKVKWREDGPGIGYNPTYYSNCESYINSVIILYGKGYKTNSGQIELLEGEHKFPFKFNLPVKIPSSFEHKYGHIKYYLKAIIDKPWTLDYTCKLPFEVTSILDLNTQPEAKLPIQKEDFKNFGFLSLGSGSLLASIHINQTGYVPGEKIYINAEINNSSNKTISYSEVTLEMKIKFRTQKKTKIRTVNLISVRGDSIKPGQSGALRDKVLEIPPLCTPQLIYCSIIDIEYKLKFSVCTTWRTLLNIPAKILIGTIPLRT